MFGRVYLQGGYRIHSREPRSLLFFLNILGQNFQASGCPGSVLADLTCVDPFVLCFSGHRSGHVGVYRKWTRGRVPEVDTWVCTGSGHVGVYRKWTRGRVPEVDTWACAGSGHVGVYRKWTLGGAPEIDTCFCCRSGHVSMM